MKKPAVHILLIALVGLLAYSNTFHVPFHFDDVPNIVENPIIKDLRYFAEPSSASGYRLYDAFQSRFVGYLFFALNYHLHGLDVTGYHLVNLAIHVMNALLVYWLVILTFSTPVFEDRQNAAHRPGDQPRTAVLIALFSALLFVSHPVQTQAVTYIVQRFASLATMFYLLSFVLYVKWRTLCCRTEDPGDKEQKPWTAVFFWYLASLLSAVLAMKTKEIAFTLPLVITLYEFMFFEGPVRKRISWLIPLLLTMIIIPMTLAPMEKPIGEIIGDVGEVMRLQSDVSRWDYLLTQFRVIVTYIRLLFLPMNQNLDYDYPMSHSLFEPAVYLSFLVLTALFGLGICLVYRSRQLPATVRLTAFGIFWFFMTLSIESSVIPILDVIFEHRVYLPSIGFIIAVISAVVLVMSTLRHKWQKANPLLVALLIFVILIFSSASYARNALWQDRILLWESVVEGSPFKSRAHNNLGQAYSFEGMTENARKQYQIAIELDFNNAQAHFNLGLSFLGTRNTHDARREFETALQLDPDLYQAQQFLSYISRSENGPHSQ